jgi:hypothetical protein
MTTRALSPSTRSFHFLRDMPTPGDAGRIGFLLRFRERQEQIDGHTELPTDLLMQRYQTLALSRFKIGEIVLGDADGDRKLILRHAAPFAQHPNGVLVSRQPIHNSLWQHDLETGRDLLTRVAHDASCPDILVGDEPGKPIVFALRKDGEFLAARGLDELNLGHDFLLHQQQQAVTHIRHPEVPEPKARTRASSTRYGEGLEGRRPPKLTIADLGARYADLGHARDQWPIILRGSLRSLLRMTAMGRFLSPMGPVDRSAVTADRDINVKLNIAYCDNSRCQ